VTSLPRTLRDYLPRAAALTVAARSREGRKTSISAENILADMDPTELRDMCILLATFVDARALLSESIGAPIEPLENSIDASARRFEVTVDDMLSTSRRQEVVEARQVASYVSHRLFGVSCTQVGRAMNRDHSTILFSVGRVGENPRLRRIALDIAERLGWTRPDSDDSTEKVIAS
jgi:hypothetical protein